MWRVGGKGVGDLRTLKITQRRLDSAGGCLIAGCWGLGSASFGGSLRPVFWASRRSGWMIQCLLGAFACEFNCVIFGSSSKLHFSCSDSSPRAAQGGCGSDGHSSDIDFGAPDCQNEQQSSNQSRVTCSSVNGIFETTSLLSPPQRCFSLTSVCRAAVRGVVGPRSRPHPAEIQQIAAWNLRLHKRF